MPFKQVHLIINPGAGQPEPILHTVNDVLYESDLHWQVSVTTAKKDGTTLTKEAIADGADCIVAYGGDGTVKSVVNGLMDSDVPLALLHGGTGNAVAHELCVPKDLKTALGLINGDHKIRQLDVGQVTCDNDKDHPDYFLLRSSIGMQNNLLKEATPELKERFGNIAYLAAGLKSLAGSDKTRFRLTIDGETMEAEGLTCIIANSAAVGGSVNFAFAPGVHPDDGELDVFVLDTGLESLISMMNSSLGENLDDYPNHWCGKEIRVEMDEDATVSLDGEEFGDLPITATLIPQAVRVIVPA